MMRRLAPELVLAFHFAFVLFVYLAVFSASSTSGGCGYMLQPWFGPQSSILPGTCPLTPLEQELRRRASLVDYDGGFVAHYIGPLVYPSGMPRRLELTAAVSITVWNALVYSVIGIAQI